MTAGVPPEGREGQQGTTSGQTSVAHLTGRFLRMLSIALEELDAVRDASGRAEYAGLSARAGWYSPARASAPAH